MGRDFYLGFRVGKGVTCSLCSSVLSHQPAFGLERLLAARQGEGEIGGWQVGVLRRCLFLRRGRAPGVEELSFWEALFLCTFERGGFLVNSKTHHYLKFCVS